MSGNPGQAVSGLGDAAGNWIAHNRNTLMALGAGMAGAQNLGQGLSRGMGAAIPAMQTDQRQQIMNQTAQALMKRGLPQDVALAAATNPAIMQQLIPSLFGGRKLMNVNGVLIDEATGQKVADYSEATKWQLGKVTDPNTGIETSVLYQPGTGQTKSIAPGALPQATGAGGPATANMSIPPEVRSKSTAEQFRDAPDGSTLFSTHGGRRQPTRHLLHRHQQMLAASPHRPSPSLPRRRASMFPSSARNKERCSPTRTRTSARRPSAPCSSYRSRRQRKTSIAIRRMYSGRG